MKYILLFTLLLSFKATASQKECLFISGGEFRQGQQISHHFRAKVLKNLDQLTIKEDTLSSELSIRSFDDFSFNLYARQRCTHIQERDGHKCFSTYLRGHHTKTYFYLNDRELSVVKPNNTPWETWEASTEDIYICH